MYAATVGGVRLTEPSVDLAIALALASGLVNLSVPGSVVAIGEVGPGRGGAPGQRRAAAAGGGGADGFPAGHRARRARGVAAGGGSAGAGIEVREAADIRAAMAAAFGG